MEELTFSWEISPKEEPKKKKKSTGIKMITPGKKKEEPAPEPQGVTPFSIGTQIGSTPSATASLEFSIGVPPTLGFDVTATPLNMESSIQSSMIGSITGNVQEVDLKKNSETSERTLNELESNVPSIEKFQAINAMLVNTVNQIEIGLSSLNQDSNTIRASNDRKKYEYLSEIHSTMGTYLNTKITALREMANIMTKCQDYDYKRAKDANAIAANQNDDGMVIQDYKAFVNMPRGVSDYTPLGPTSRDMTIFGNVNGYNVGGGNGYEQYVQNMTPAQHMMQLEGDPNIKEVMFYDMRTGRKWFDVVDIRTNQHVPNTEVYDPMLLEEFEIDINKGLARSINMGITLPLIVIKDEALQYY